MPQQQMEDFVYLYENDLVFSRHVNNCLNDPNQEHCYERIAALAKEEGIDVSAEDCQNYFAKRKPPKKTSVWRRSLFSKKEKSTANDAPDIQETPYQPAIDEVKRFEDKIKNDLSFYYQYQSFLKNAGDNSSSTIVKFANDNQFIFNERDLASYLRSPHRASNTTNGNAHFQFTLDPIPPPEPSIASPKKNTA